MKRIVGKDGISKRGKGNGAGKRSDVGHFFSGEFRGRGEAADGFSKWIFLVCNEAAASAAAFSPWCFQRGRVERRTERRGGR